MASGPDSHGLLPGSGGDRKTASRTEPPERPSDGTSSIRGSCSRDARQSRRDLWRGG
jgi:hypothetical protein